MYYLSGLLLLALSPLGVRAQGWWLDGSCTNRPNSAAIRSAIEGAIGLASDISNKKFGNGRYWEIWDDEEKRLYNLLIGGGESDRAEVRRSYRNVAFGSISSVANNEDSAFLKIYCDLSRFKPVKVAGESVLKSRTDKKAYKEEKVSCKVNQAWTTSDTPLQNVIQICPWYADKIQPAFVPYGRLKRVFSKAVQKIGIRKGVTDVDFYAHPYTTIFHELMHTTEGGKRDDTGPGMASYGWINVVKIGSKPESYNNADNLMYFALALDLYNKKRIVQDDGSIKDSS